MSDFTKYSNYQKNSAFSQVVFGAQSPVLEVELNEMQQIIDYKLQAILRALGKGVVFNDPTSEANIEVANNTISLYDGVILSNGYVIQFSDLTATSVTNGKYVYAKISQVDADYNTTLKSEGNASHSTITNTIKDTRLGVETSRRKVVTFEILTGSTVPSDDGTYQYVKLLHKTASGEIVLNIAGTVHQNNDLTFSVDTDGILCVTYDE